MNIKVCALVIQLAVLYMVIPQTSGWWFVKDIVKQFCGVSTVAHYEKTHIQSVQKETQIFKHFLGVRIIDCKIKNEYLKSFAIQ